MIAGADDRRAIGARAGVGAGAFYLYTFLERWRRLDATRWLSACQVDASE